jgi:hypothetical protein
VTSLTLEGGGTWLGVGGVEGLVRTWEQAKQLIERGERAQNAPFRDTGRLRQGPRVLVAFQSRDTG